PALALGSAGRRGALSQITENRKVEALKPLIFRDPIFGFCLQKATLRQSPTIWSCFWQNMPNSWASSSVGASIIVSASSWNISFGETLKLRPVKCLCPLELRAGLIGGLYTPVLARQVTYLMGHMTSAETSKVFTELGIAGPSSSSCDHLPKLLSTVWERHREPWESALRQQEVVAAEAAVVAVSLDGVMVPDKDAQRFAKATREAAKKQGLSKQCSGPAGYRQVGCGTLKRF